MRKYFDSSDDFFSIINRRFKGVRSIRHVSTGWTNFVFYAKTKNSELVFRFPRNDFFRKALLKEARFLSDAEKNKFSFELPKLCILHDKGRPFSVHKKIKGKALSSCRLSAKQKEQLAEQVCLFLQELSLVQTSVKLCTTSKFLENLSKVSDRGDYDLSKHEPLLIAENLAKQTGKLTLSHADFNPGNIILRKKKMVGVLDFAFVSFSSPLDDLARLIGRSDKNFRKPLLSAFEKHFGKVDEKMVDQLVGVWSYVEEQYVRYIKEKHPDIVLPKTLS